MTDATARELLDEIEKLKAKVAARDLLLRKMSDALLEVRPLGGSEMFKRFGEGFYADPAICTSEIRRLRSELHEAKASLVKERRARTLGGSHVE